MTLGDSAEAAADPMVGDKRKGGVLSPWDLPPARLLRPGRKSAIEDAESYEELWRYLSTATKAQPYISELCSDDPILRGVAISRYTESWLSVCNAILDTDNSDLKTVLLTQVVKDIEREAATMKEHLQHLNGAGLPSRAEAMKKNKLGGSTSYQWKDKDRVETAMTWLIDWSKKPSPLRKTIGVL